MATIRISSYRGGVKALHKHLVPTDVNVGVDRLMQLSNLNSSSHNLAGLADTLTVLLDQFDWLGGEISRIALADDIAIDEQGVAHPQALGEIGRIRQRPNAPIQLLFVGHYDTVFSVDHPFQHARLDDGILIGPGTADMKGGLLIMHSALASLENSPWADQVGWEVLLTPDEEIGSPGSAPFLAAAAEGKTAGFVFEPSFPDGDLASSRKGSGTFHIHVQGLAAHAGRDHHLGRNAVVVAAKLASKLDKLNGRWDDVTVNISQISGGGPTNIVPDSAVVRLNVRVPTNELAQDFAAHVAQLAESASESDGITATVHGTFTRPPKELTEGITALLGAARASARSLGLDLGWRPTGGVSDGNNLAAAGLPNLDNLGVHGGNIHSDSEFMYPQSLETRSAITGLIVLSIASGALEVPQ